MPRADDDLGPKIAEDEFLEDDEEYEIDPATIADLDLSDPKRWCETPAPKGKMIQCKIERDKTSIGKKFLPVTFFYLLTMTGVSCVSGQWQYLFNECKEAWHEHEL
jgi:hypothetical protein